MDRMVKYVEIPRAVCCPKWNINVCLHGKYYLSDDINSTIGKFKSAVCPIVENSKLPFHEQATEYKLLRCLEYLQCPFLNDFPKEIDTCEITRIE